MGDLRRNSGVAEDRPLMTSLLPANPDPSAISDESWGAAEETTKEVVGLIHPTLDSEEKRKDVIEHVQRLIRTSLNVEVFPYGSVPLKTYLPDGDIDLTALSSPDVEESLARDVLTVLQREEQNENAEYELKDTQFIDAEVKLVKCLVQDIVIDISFNQLGGLCTLCFLEQVDRLVGKDHLFKRSIILIKAWCYYESRILGAHHGLISTYALETLVLYIFHFFNSSFNDPLSVLYRFLDYFSKFDWENYCISLNGPVCKLSLPDVVVEKPENEGDNLMLSEEFMRNCVDMFTVPSRGPETNLRAFPQKHLNIIDPLKENNNLGRSVHRGNYYRIRSAFKYGARKLGRILLLPRERISDEIKKFFSNTLGRHGRKYGGTDIHISDLIFGANGLGTLSSPSHANMFSEDELYLNSALDFDDDMFLEEKDAWGFTNELATGPAKVISSQVPETGCSTDGTAVSGQRLAGDANELATFGSLSLRTANEISECSPPSSNFTTTLSGQCDYAPPSYFTESATENGICKSGNLCQNKSSDFVDEKMRLYTWLEQEKHVEAGNTSSINIDSVKWSNSSVSSLDANISESISLDFRERDGYGGEVEAINPLSDLSGDYDSHIRSLVYGQGCHGYALSASAPHSARTSHIQIRNKKPWDTVRRYMPLKRNSSSEMTTNGAVMEPSAYYANNCTSSSALLSLEERDKTRGTGTYFPNMKCSCRERPQGRGKNQAPVTCRQLQRHARKNGHALPEASSSGGSSQELPRVQPPAQGCGKSGQSRHSARGVSDNNGFPDPYSLEFGSLGRLAAGCSQSQSRSYYV
ncbi:hypothetical protein RJ639_043294 [Escallonia herrerae]|uniref:PAP-associated domain-containing protein n=1 Tax=Escallonia herrerae TaxID=1293975 RepID=A0AA89B1V0_9ASTE|nr:hypothetical protein RJ639_043294 [Escallonia herrerae]